MNISSEQSNKKQRSHVDFSMVPKEMVFVMMQFFSGVDLEALRLVCKRFNSVAMDNILWRSAVLAEFHPLSFNPQYYHFNFRNCYRDLYRRRVLNRERNTIVISTLNRKIQLYRLREDNDNDVDDYNNIVKEMVDLCAVPSVATVENAEEIYRQPTFSPYGDLLAVTCYQNMDNQSNLPSFVLIKRVKSKNKLLVGRDIVRIKTERISFYHYWSPDGVFLTWLSSYLDPQTQTERIGYWIINVNELLLRFYHFFREQLQITHDTCESIWDFFDEHPELIIDIVAPTPNDIGVPYFYAWQPLPNHKQIRSQVELEFNKPSSFSIVRPHHYMFVHKNLKYMIKMDMYTSASPSTTTLMSSHNQLHFPYQHKLEQHEQSPVPVKSATSAPLQEPTLNSSFDHHVTNTIHAVETSEPCDVPAIPPLLEPIYLQPQFSFLNLEKKYGMFDCPLWLNASVLIYVESRVKFQQDVKTEEHLIVFEDIVQHKIIREIVVSSPSVALALSADKTHFAYSTFSPLGLCSGVTVINLISNKFFVINGSIKIFYFASGGPTVQLVYLSTFLSTSQWCTWSETDGEYSLEAIDPNTYTDRAYYQFFCQYNLSTMWSSPDGKYMTCPGYCAKSMRASPRESHVWIQRLKKGSKPLMVVPGLYSCWVPM